MLVDCCVDSSSFDLPPLAVQGELFVKNTVVSGSIQTGGILVVGKQARACLLNSSVMNCNGAGVEVRKGAKAVLRGCELHGNMYGALVWQSSLQFAAESCAFFCNSRSGLTVGKLGWGSSVHVRNCTSFYNAGHGAEVNSCLDGDDQIGDESSNIELTGGTFCRNQQCGLFLDDRVIGLEKNIAAANARGSLVRRQVGGRSFQEVVARGDHGVIEIASLDGSRCSRCGIVVSKAIRQYDGKKKKKKRSCSDRCAKISFEWGTQNK
jgi:hypothetical protein